MRFHEFYRIEDGRVVEIQALWDIPEVMMQAGAWPMVPQPGRLEWHVPGPATQDGIVPGPYGTRKPAKADLSAYHRHAGAYLKRHPSQGGPEVMEMKPRFWHPNA